MPGGSVVEWLPEALDSQLDGCELDSRPPRCRATTLGKLFTPTSLRHQAA